MGNPRFVFSLLIATMLMACSTNIPTHQPTSTNIVLSSTAMISPSETPPIAETPTGRPTFTRTPSLTPLPTETVIIPVYLTKQVVLKYIHYGGFGSPDTLLLPFFGDNRGWFHFVLYSDNQFIFQKNDNEPIRTKILTEGERNSLFSELNKKGFYDIDTHSDSFETNPIYDFKDHYVEVSDGLSSCLFTGIPVTKKLCIYQPYREFLITPVKDLFEFMDHFTPGNLTVYQPDRLLLFVSKGRALYHQYEPGILPPHPTAIPWPDDLPSLQTAKEKYMYFEGEEATEVFSLINNPLNLIAFSDQGDDYSVYVGVVLPHETLTQP